MSVPRMIWEAEPTSTNAEIDETLHDFQCRNGRMPTTKELRELLPGGVSNDRASAARTRARKAKDGTVHFSADLRARGAAKADGSSPEKNDLAGAIIAVLLQDQTDVDRVVDE